MKLFGSFNRLSYFCVQSERGELWGLNENKSTRFPGARLAGKSIDFTSNFCEAACPENLRKRRRTREGEMQERQRKNADLSASSVLLICNRLILAPSSVITASVVNSDNALDNRLYFTIIAAASCVMRLTVFASNSLQILLLITTISNRLPRSMHPNIYIRICLYLRLSRIGFHLHV